MNPSIGIVTLNAKFIHSSLSLRYLRNAARRAGHSNVWIREFTINQPLWKIAAAIQNLKPDVLGISIYIWNRRQSFELIEILKKQNPNLQIIIGGPEVSFEDALSPEHTTIAGEGETKWVECLDHIERGETPSPEILERWNTYGNDLPDLHPPYIEEDFDVLQNRYAYIETSRGCPFLCSFCLSALDKKVQYFDDEAIRQQITQLVDAGIKKVKFVDRTFNLQPKRVRQLMQWLTAFEGIEFHFEVVGDLLDEETLKFLDTVPRGMFQFEIGIQTTTDHTQTLIQRKQDRAKLLGTLTRLIERDRIHLHCDLLFGLPGETLAQAMDSFSQVVALRPHALQLGFLKFLPGTPIRALIDSHEYRYLSTPPYELIAHRDLSADDVLYLKKFDEAFDLFYNSKRFRFSLDHLMERRSAVELFDSLVQWMETNDAFENLLSLDRQYEAFAETFDLLGDAMSRDLLKLDYLYHQRTFRLPEFLKAQPNGNGAQKLRTWQGDRKTPLVPFQHEIIREGARIALKPASDPLFYAIAHPNRGPGYLPEPRIERVDAPAG